MLPAVLGTRQWSWDQSEKPYIERRIFGKCRWAGSSMACRQLSAARAVTSAFHACKTPRFCVPLQQLLFHRPSTQRKGRMAVLSASGSDELSRIPSLLSSCCTGPKRLSAWIARHFASKQLRQASVAA